MKNYLKLFCLVICLSVASNIFFVDAYAQKKISEKEDKIRKRQSISTSVGKALTEAIEFMGTKEYSQAIQIATEQLNKSKLKPYDEASILEIRASCYASLDPPNFKAALRDFAKILQIDTFDNKRTQNIIYNVAALYFSQEDYDNAIRYMKFWIENSDVEKPDAYYILAGAYVSKEDFRNAKPIIEKAMSLLTEPKKSIYELANYIYSETGEVKKRIALLEKMIGLWPENKNSWAQLSGLYAEQGDEKNAYLILSLAYSVGLLNKEGEIKALASYMAQLDNPYRAAKLIEKELKSGLLKRDNKTVEMLSLFWTQAREYDKSIPALEEAARLADKGKLYFRLGQSYFSDQNWAKAESSLYKALNKGGLKSSEIGDVWLLIGTAQFNQASDRDNSKRTTAKKSFANALKYPNARTAANNWLSYIQNIEKTELDQARLEKAQEAELRKIEEERKKSQERTDKLRGN